MKISNIQRPYHMIMSLGYNCMTAYQLKRLSLRIFSGPFDWVISNDPEKLIQLLDSQLKGYMEEQNLRILGTHNGFYSVEDTVFQIYSFHDFPVVGEIRAIANYPSFREKIDRRINNFLHLASHADSALFIRENCTYEDAIRLKASLSRLVKGTVHLLIINHTDTATLVDKDWGIDGICNVELIPSHTDEHIRDPYWNELLSGVSLLAKK